MLLPTEITLKFNDNDIEYNTVLSDEEKMNYIDKQIYVMGLYCKVVYIVQIMKQKWQKIIELDKPLIGICAGFNNILRAIGTDVIEDKTKSHDIYDKEYRHEISIIKGTKLFDLVKKEKYNVNSIHSMIAPKGNVEKYARISAISYDNLVESFELDNKNL